MKEFTFSVPQDIISGAGCINKLPDILKKCGAKSALIISGHHLEKLGTVKKVSDIITSSGLSCSSFTDVEANPSVETADAAAKAYKDSGADCIIALGGGSPMDTAKAAAILAVYGGKITEYEGGGKVPGKVAPLIAIPTTAGTGSEVTAFSVITDKSRNYKLTVFSYELIPQYALLDPDLLSELPASVAAATGIDAFVHAMESYISKAASPFSEAMSEKAMELIGKNIRAFVADRKNSEAAAAMLTASAFAGIAFSWARLGDVHAMAHPVSGFFNVAHGVANAILLPIVTDFNALADCGKYKKIYDFIALNPTENFTPDMLSAEIRALTKSLGLPQTLSEVGCTSDKIPAMAHDALLSGNIAVNPRSSTLEDIEKLYELAM